MRELVAAGAATPPVENDGRMFQLSAMPVSHHALASPVLAPPAFALPSLEQAVLDVRSSDLQGVS